MFLAKETAIIVGSYLLGCLATGYYLVRWRTGQDLRSLGSGSTGGTNAGRVLGRWGLVLTGLVDILKGAVAVGAALYFRLDAWAVVLAAAAVVAGHVFPFQLGFHGGRGLETVTKADAPDRIVRGAQVVEKFAQRLHAIRDEVLDDPLRWQAQSAQILEHQPVVPRFFAPVSFQI